MISKFGYEHNLDLNLIFNGRDEKGTIRARQAARMHNAVEEKHLALYRAKV